MISELKFENTVEFARMCDMQDPLLDFRNKFIIPETNGKQQIYFLGNSLGLQPKSTKTEIQKVLDQWSQYGVEAFFMGDEPWMDYHDKLTKPLSKIVGAKPGEVVVMNQLTVNLHLMMVSFTDPWVSEIKSFVKRKHFPVINTCLKPIFAIMVLILMKY